MAQKKGIDAPRIENRKARHEFTIESELEVGIVLLGSEVKSLRAGKANLVDAYAIEQNNEIWLNNMYIAEWAQANQFNHAPRRLRKLLLKRKEINKLIGLIKREGITLVPLLVFFNDKGLAKVRLAVAKGKKKYEKRESEKERDWDREKGRIMRHHVGD
jgi:SsrA-binding protein